MTGYCRTRHCLRQYILRYFGQDAPDDCGACYNCLHNFREVEVGREARTIVECVAKTGQHFGVGVIAETLCGADTDKVRKYHMDRENSHGALRELSQKAVRERIRFLLDEGILALSPGPYPVLQLGERAEDVARNAPALYMRTMEEERPAARRQAPTELEGGQAELFQRLRALRARTARRQGVPAYVVFSDRTLRELAAAQPRSMAELRGISGIGEAKAGRYGQAFLREIRDFLEG